LNKHTVIVILASIVIVSPFVYSGLNIYGADQLKFEGVEGKFSYYDMMSGKNIVLCNPLPFYVNFNGINIVPFFEGKNKGTLSILPVSISPSSSTIVNGTFKSDTYEEIQYLFLNFDNIFSGTSPLRIDPEKFSVVTEIQMPIIGVIPYSVTKQYSGMDFWNTMNEKNGNFNC